MTLIVELHEPNIGSIFISDCMAFDERASEKRESGFPLHVRTGWKIDTRGTSIASKFLTRDKNFVLSAGYVKNILKYADDFLSLAHLGFKEFQDFLDSVYSDNKKHESFIYGTQINGQPHTTDSYCKRFKVGHLEITCAGFGSDLFYKKFSKLHPSPDKSIFELSAEALAILMRLEFTNINFSDNYFGGAYEMAFYSKDGLKRIPYRIVDFSANSTRGQDGVWDIYNPELSRIISCIPLDKGTRFAVTDVKSPETESDFVDALEISEVDTTMSKKPKDLLEILEGFNSAIDIAIIRHSEVNFRLAKDLISTTFDDGKMIIRLDWEVFNAAMNAQ